MNHRTLSRLAAFIVCLSASAAPFDGLRADSGPVIRSHRAFLSLDPENRILACRDTVTLFFTDRESESASLRLNPAFDISSLTTGGEKLEYTAGRGGTLSFAREGGDSLMTVEIAYRGRMDFRSEFTRLSADRAILREEEVLPWGTRELTSGTLRVSVPREWTVLAAGTPVVTDDPAGRSVWTFTWNEPLAALGWICAGRYTVFRNPGGPPGISLHLFPGESADTASILSLCDSLLRFYGSAFGPYRYDRLDVVEIDDWVAGPRVLAIAAPSFVMLKRSTFGTTDPYNTAQTVLPHEVAHEWWMGNVFFRELDTPFLSEGLSEYSSALFGRWRGWAGPRDTLQGHPLLRPLLARVRRHRDLPLDSTRDIRTATTQYLKAAYVHHMLAGIVGDSLYGNFLRRLSAAYSGRWLTIGEFRAGVGRAAGRDLGWFFDQWVGGTGLPAFRLYNFTAARDDSGWTVSGRVRVLGYDRYTALLTVELRTEGDPVRERVRVGLDSAGAYLNDVGVRFRSASAPVGAVLDPDGDVLMMRKIPEKFSDLREPGSGALVVGSGPRSVQYGILAERDSASLTLQGWSVRILRDTEVSLADLQNGHVIFYGNETDNLALKELPVQFPLNGDSTGTPFEGEFPADSTLAMMQIMENPYVADGLMVWINPLGPAARPELLPFDKSWVLQRGKDEIASGTWEVEDDQLHVVITPKP